MKFELNSYTKDSMTGHSVYEFGSIENDSQTQQMVKNPPIYNKKPEKRKKLASKEAMPFVVKKLIQMKVEAFTIKQLLN